MILRGRKLIFPMMKWNRPTKRQPGSLLGSPPGRQPGSASGIVLHSKRVEGVMDAVLKSVRGARRRIVAQPASTRTKRKSRRR
jgi:hypothetical protein